MGGAAVTGMGEALKMQRSHRLELLVPLGAGPPGRKSLYGEKIHTYRCKRGSWPQCSAVLLSYPPPLRAFRVFLLFPCTSDL